MTALILPKYSIGIGDRFARQGRAQLDALILARRHGVDIAPVWNKSSREHSTIGSRPEDVRAEAREAVRASRWNGPYFVDADHVGLKTVDAFLAASDFFTIDVAEWIGVDAAADAVERFVARHERLVGRQFLPGLDRPLDISRQLIFDTARKVLAAVCEAWLRFDELCAPYASVVAIDREALPSPESVGRWSGESFAAALRHDPACVSYNPNFRQLLHVAYKVAAEMGDRFTSALDRHAAAIAENVTHNLFERHIRPLFLP